jgi:peroxiredoxin
MAQLRHDNEKFQKLNAEILVMVPNGPRMIERYVGQNHPPYPILSDKGSRVAGEYLQVKQFFSLGTPTVFVVDQAGMIRYAHYAASLLEEPDNQEPLVILEKLKE